MRQAVEHREKACPASRPTVCGLPHVLFMGYPLVSVDSASEQKKPAASLSWRTVQGKLLVNRARREAAVPSIQCIIPVHLRDALLGRRSDLGKPVNNRIRTNRSRCATSGRQARDPGFRWEVVHAAIRTQADELLQLDRQAPPRVRL
jgi:hypothetical protein